MASEENALWNKSETLCTLENRSRADSDPMTYASEKRESSRRPHTTTIMFENYLTGNYYEGRMVDYSRGGMGFEADFAPSVGTEIFIGIEKSPYSASHDVFRAQVVWTRELPLTDSSYSFGIGVKYS
jgi:hypothetical protein